MMTLACGVAAVMQRFARFASSAAQGGSASAKLSLLTKGKEVVTALTKEQLLNRTDHGMMMLMMMMMMMMKRKTSCNTPKTGTLKAQALPLFFLTVN